MSTCEGGWKTTPQHCSLKRGKVGEGEERSCIAVMQITIIRPASQYLYCYSCYCCCNIHWDCLIKSRCLAVLRKSSFYQGIKWGIFCLIRRMHHLHLKNQNSIIKARLLNLKIKSVHRTPEVWHEPRISVNFSTTAVIQMNQLIYWAVLRAQQSPSR